MTDAQYLFDLAAKQYNDTAEVIEKHFENVADQIRDWIPRRMQNVAPPPPPKKSLPISYLNKIQDWAIRHRAITAGIVAFVGTGAVYLILQRNAYRQKRRAKRSPDGARTEVVVLAGAATSPLVTALALDLERRGYIVYVVTHSQEDVHHVRGQSRVDILPLNLDLVYPENPQEQVSRLHDMLDRHHFAIEGGSHHRLSLAGVILVPDTPSYVAPFADITPEAWSQALNAKVLNTILTTQNLWSLITDFHSRVLLLTPSIVASLNPPNHTIDSVVGGALQGFAASLSAELQQNNLKLCHVKLGYIETPGSSPRNNDQRGRIRGTPIRKLHDVVFDALQSRRPWRTTHVGKGSLTYDLIGAWAPSSLVGWIMGLSKPENPHQESRLVELNDGGSESSATWERIEESEQAS